MQISTKHSMAFETICIIFTRFSPFPTGISKDCSVLPNPPNGQVTQNSTSVGSIARYSCDKGFELNGAEERECLGDGNWSEREPSCDSKHTSF